MNQTKVKNKKDILNAIAPCSMFCTTCTGCKYGDVSYHAKELVRLLQGHEEFLEKNLKDQYRYKLEEYKAFSKKLKKYANAKCGGCRNNRVNGCCIEGCIIPECVKEHHVDFCAECNEFPCDKINERIYKKTIIKKWLDGNNEIKEKGIEQYYEKNKNCPHYIDYIKIERNDNLKIQVNNEYGKLKKVVVSSAEYYDPTDLAINNETIKFYKENGDIPAKEDILNEQQEFWKTLRNLSVDVLVADQVPLAKGQMFTRDLAFVIGNKFFISNMRKENRKKAINGWKNIIDKIPSSQIIKVPSNVYLEGGDIIVNENTIYVGISERTNEQGVEFLKKELGKDYQVIPLKLKEKFLHLDVVLTIINPNLILIYKEGLEEESLKALENYYKIELTEKEQFELGTNVFVVDENTVIVNSNHTRIIKEIQNYNLNVIPLNMSETAKDGGAFRCTTCPLERE